MILYRRGLIKDGLDETFVHTLYCNSAVTLEPRVMAGNLKRKESTLDYSQFLENPVVSKGKQYSKEHRESLDRAYQQFGVPPSVVVAILSVETRLGTWTGTHQAVSVLSTTAIGKDPRLHDKVYSSFKQPPSKAEFDEKNGSPPGPASRLGIPGTESPLGNIPAL